MSITEEVGKGAFPAIELIRLLPQRICFELPERRLNPGAPSWVRGDSSHRERGAAEQAQLAAERRVFRLQRRSTLQCRREVLA
jgi:hypothetical protein